MPVVRKMPAIGNRRCRDIPAPAWELRTFNKIIHTVPDNLNAFNSSFFFFE